MLLACGPACLRVSARLLVKLQADLPGLPASHRFPPFVQGKVGSAGAYAANSVEPMHVEGDKRKSSAGVCCSYR